jgi:uncharacterized protein YozE (UPF0346 family)
MKLPLVPEEITASWLTAALGFRHRGVQVLSASVEDVIRGTSTKIRVRLHYASHGAGTQLPATLIVKGGFEQHSPSMKDMYLNEIRFYRDVLPYIDINTPRCFYTGSDPATHQSIVILEDLRAKNVTFCHPQRPINYEQVARRLEAMACYHAQTWNSPEFQPGGRFDWVKSRYEGFNQVYIDRYLVPEIWDYYMQQPRAAAVPRILHNRDWMQRALKNLAAYHRQWPVCLVHGDTHLGNLYFEADGTPGFFDAQTSRGPWQLEVNYHVVVALDIADRRRWEKPLLVRYLESLKAHGVAAPSFDEAWEAYRRETAYGYFIFAINENRFQTEAVNTAEAARFGAAALDHDTVRLLS